MRLTMVGAGVVALVVVVGSVGCSSRGDDEEGGAAGERREDRADPLDGDGRGAYVVAFGEAGRDPVSGEVTEESTCVAEAVVEAVGVAELREVGSPREVAAAANGEGASLAALGVEVDAARSDAIYVGIAECGDPARMVLEAVPGMGLTGPVAECFLGRVGDDLAREVLMTRLVEGDEAFAGKPEVAAELTAIGRACAAGEAA